MGRRLRLAGSRPIAQRLLRAALLLLLVFVTGVLGFILIEGQGVLDAVYHTTITISGVGFEPPAGPGGLSAAGKAFTVILIWGGVGVVAYLLLQVVGVVVSGELNEAVRARRMEKVISGLRGHIIVCGTAESGEQALAEIIGGATPLVVVANDKAYIEHLSARFGELLSVEGLPTEATTLERANVAAAKALLACLPTDAENLFLTMTARELAPEVFIVAQATDPAAIDKLRKVGADHVVAPAVIAGTRMASVALRPTAVAFLDVLVRSGEEALRLEEVPIPAGSRWAGSTLAEVRIPQQTELLVMGLRHKSGDGEFVFNPSAATRLEAGDELVVLGTPDQRAKLEALLAEKKGV